MVDDGFAGQPRRDAATLDGGQAALPAVVEELLIDVVPLLQLGVW
jgi:hypothetical protein